MTLRTKLKKNRVTEEMYLMVGYYKNCWLNMTLCRINSIPLEFLNCTVLEDEYLTINGIDYYKFVVNY